MDRSLRWIHLSDWHCPINMDLMINLVFEKLVEDIDRICNSGELSGKNFIPDFLVHTGDVSFSGKPLEFKNAIQIFHNILDVIPNLNQKSLFIVPGNHDVNDDGFVHKASELYMAKDQHNYLIANEEWLDQKSLKKKDLLRKFENFIKAFSVDFPLDHLMTDSRPSYSYEFISNSGFSVGILGLCSALVSLKDDEEVSRKMALGMYQINDTQNNFYNKIDVSLGLMHHPFEKLADIDRQYCENLIRDKVHFVLHGHVHVHNNYIEVRPDKSIGSLGSGACFENWRKSSEQKYGYQLVEYFPESRKIKIHFRKWSQNEKCFLPNNEIAHRANRNGTINLTLPQKQSERVKKKNKFISLNFLKREIPVSELEDRLIFGGYTDRTSHSNLSEKIIRHMSHDKNLPNKYLYWHIDSRNHYYKLVAEESYTIWKDSFEICQKSFPDIAKKLTSIWNKGPYSIVSLGIGKGTKEFILIEEILKIQDKSQIALVFIDINYQMIEWAMTYFQSQLQFYKDNISAYFIHADFERLESLKDILPAHSGATIFSILGGTFGNQDEMELLSTLKKSCPPNSYSILGVQSLESLVKTGEISLVGYSTNSNLRFVELPLVHFDIEYRKMDLSKRKIKANLNDDSYVVKESLKIITSAESPTFGTVQLASSTRYDINSLKSFLAEAKTNIEWESKNMHPRYWKTLIKIK